MSDGALMILIRLATLIANEKDIIVKAPVIQSAAFEDKVKRIFPEWVSLLSRDFIWRLLAVWALGFVKTEGYAGTQGRTKKRPEDIEVPPNIKLDTWRCIDANKEILALEKEFGLKWS